MTDTNTPSRLLRIFLCHSSADKPAVRELYQRFQADGFEPWLDEEDLIPGQDWQREIPKAVKNSDIVIVCLSRGSVNKAGYVQKEIKFALDVAEEQPEGTIFIIPLKLEECEVPDRLRRWQWVNYFAENGYSRLLRALRTRAGSFETGIPILYAKGPTVETPPTLQPSSEVTNQSGGVNVDAEQVNAGQDIVGRDKVVSAGGHIIHAEAGATVIISQNPLMPIMDQPVSNDSAQKPPAKDYAEENTLRESTKQEWFARVDEGFEPIPFETPASDHPYGYPVAPVGRWLLGKEKIPFILLEHRSGQGHRVVEVKPQHARDQVAKDIKPAEVRNSTSLYVLLSAGDTSRTRVGIRFEGKEIGRLVIQFYDDSAPQIIPLRLGIELREWVSGESRTGFNVVAKASSAEEVWQSLDRRHTLDMIKVDISDGPKDILNVFVVGECNWLTEDFKESLPSIRISGVTYQVAPSQTLI
jgi:hypothetical protein